ncbi:CBS domain-containing protein [Geomonas sp. Red32]|uniref:CBS domain-containing protein n=1 Tax=Geomonas sp. Red32 TaxID=2912856 RepID=UPI00202CD334|nr:CBS domain-containing protein [Geomonas sp. Red32]MCM0083405.1 CBS domain-containing protein [Geomonas sp. Red32]
MTKVKRWMTTNPIVIEADATVIEAMHLMKEKKIRRLPVMKKGKIAGILTEAMVKDFTPSKATALDTWELHYILSKTPVTKAMNPKPFMVTPDTDLTEAAALLHDRKLNGVLVVDDKKLVGILTITNALEALIAICKDPRLAENGDD